MLKERRPLVLVPRESPLSTIHLRNMLTLAESGTHIVPAMPAFYTRPKDLEDAIAFVVDRAITSAGLDIPLRAAWREDAP
jgi:4-hydroxy-3-polyprenylbenzoate decarboxylase